MQDTRNKKELETEDLLDNCPSCTFQFYFHLLQDLEKKRLIQLEAQKEIARANQESEEMKQKKQEQEKLADLKVTEYMKQKAEREAAFEAEQERIRIEKEKEIARLRALQVNESIKPHLA